MIARALNRAGLARFQSYLSDAAGGTNAEPPRGLLDDGAYTYSLPDALEVEPRGFADRRELGAYLCDVLRPLPRSELDGEPGLWAWLSLYWFDQLCPLRADGTRRAGEERRHIPAFGTRRYRHLLYGPYLVYRRHGPRSLVLLSGPIQRISNLYETITSRYDLIANRGIIEAALLLYVDPHTAKIKRGCQPASPRPGTIRRFARVIQQLDLTFDVFGMSGPQILDFLPAEFDAWRPERRPRAARGAGRTESDLSDPPATESPSGGRGGDERDADRPASLRSL